MPVACGPTGPRTPRAARHAARVAVPAGHLVPQVRLASMRRASARLWIAAISAGANVQSRGPMPDFVLRPHRAHEADWAVRRRGQQQVSEFVRDRAAEQHAAVGACLLQPATARDRNRWSPALQHRCGCPPSHHRVARFPDSGEGMGDRTIRMASSPGAMGAFTTATVGAQAPDHIDGRVLQRLPCRVERGAVRPCEHAVRVVDADDDIGPASDRPTRDRRHADEREDEDHDAGNAAT